MAIPIDMRRAYIFLITSMLLFFPIVLCLSDNKESAKVDLIVEKFFVSEVLEGTPTNITVYIENIGTENAYDVDVEAYDGKPNEGGKSLGIKTLPLIRANGCIERVEWDVHFLAGNHLIYIIVDPLNKIAKSNEGNNLMFKNAHVGRMSNEHRSYFKTPRLVVERYLYLDSKKSMGTDDRKLMLSLFTDEKVTAPEYPQCMEFPGVISGYKILNCVTEGSKAYCDVVYNVLGYLRDVGPSPVLDKKITRERFNLVSVDGKWKISEWPPCNMLLIDYLRERFEKWIKENEESIKKWEKELKNGPPPEVRDRKIWEERYKKTISLWEEENKVLKIFLESK